MPTCAEDYLLVEGVCKRFGATLALADVSLRVERGRIFGLVGSDGAGKTSLLRCLAGMTPPDGGRIALGGRDALRERRSLKSLIGYMPQRFGLYPDLSVAENLDFFMDIFGVTGSERARRREKYLGFSNLLPFVERPAGQLSGGMKQKLGLACVLVHEPELLILDEPTNGVDPVSRQEFWQILIEMRASGLTIVVSTAYLDEGALCDELAVMHQGRVLATGTPAAITGAAASLEEALIARLEAQNEAPHA
ncbi:MAG: putative ABC transporter ATP-binding protein YbhF [Deltaproteobacteria bacterium ADurb.Bin510]|nr:MAG: putative ABC transporter ATP-binding protein YbhF [Deltaproteobacteria bacterium ADurb.Bin510]